MNLTKHSTLKDIFYLNDSIVIVSGREAIAEPKLTSSEEKYFIKKYKTFGKSEN